MRTDRSMKILFIAKMELVPVDPGDNLVTLLLTPTKVIIEQPWTNPSKELAAKPPPRVELSYDQFLFLSKLISSL